MLVVARRELGKLQFCGKCNRGLVVFYLCNQLGDWRAGIYGEGQHPRGEGVSISERLARENQSTRWI